MINCPIIIAVPNNRSNHNPINLKTLSLFSSNEISTPDTVYYSKLSPESIEVF